MSWASPTATRAQLRHGLCGVPALPSTKPSHHLPQLNYQTITLRTDKTTPPELLLTTLGRACPDLPASNCLINPVTNRRPSEHNGCRWCQQQTMSMVATTASHSCSTQDYLTLQPCTHNLNQLSCWQAIHDQSRGPMNAHSILLN